MSSRNVFLTPDERQKALILYRVFRQMESQASTEVDLIAFGIKLFEAEPSFKLQYLELRDFFTFEPANQYKPGTKLLILAAGYLGSTRLIDNWILTDS